MGGRFVGNYQREVVEFDTELLVFLADLRELVTDGIQLGGDSHYARDGGAKNGEDGPFASGYGLECVR